MTTPCIAPDRRDRLRSWAWLGDETDPRWRDPGSAVPLTVLDEPVVLVRHVDGDLRLLSNACPHRGMLVVHRECRAHQLVCGYHGRRFDLDGRVTGAPGFDDLDGFPAPADHLARLPLGRLGSSLFASPLGTAEQFADLVSRRRAEFETPHAVVDP